MNSVIYNTENITQNYSGKSSGCFRIYKEMLEEDSNITVVIDKGLETEQTLVFSVNDFNETTNYESTTTDLDNTAKVKVYYWSSGSYEIDISTEYGYSENLNTVELTVTDKYGSEQSYSIERD